MSICDLTLEEADIIAEKICFKDDLDRHAATLKAARVTKEVLEASKLMDVIDMQIERRIEKAFSLKRRFDNILAGGEDQVNKMFEATHLSKPGCKRTNSLNDDGYTTEEDYSDTEFDKIDNQLKLAEENIPAKVPVKRKAPVKRSPAEKKSSPPTKKPKKVKAADKDEEAAKELLRHQVAKLLADIQQKSVAAATINDIVEKFDWAKRKAAKAAVNTEGKTKGRGRPKKVALEMPEAFPVVRTGKVNSYIKVAGNK